MFDKNIFQVWFQNCNNVTKPEYIQNMRNWKLLNPDWNYKCISDTELRNACAQYSPECLQVYDSFDIMHLKIDFGRYVTLYLKGGIYVDMDAYAVRSLDSNKDIQEIIKKGKDGQHVLGLSTLHINPVECYAIVGYKTMINNAIMISSPRNPLVKSFIEEIINQSKHQVMMPLGAFKVHSLTGPLHFNTFFQKYLTFHPPGHHIKIFDSTIFEPCKENDCNITKHTVSIHEMELSWLPYGLKKLHDGYYCIKNYIPLLFIIPIIYIIIRRQYCVCRI